MSSFEDSVVMTEDSHFELLSVKTRKIVRPRYTTYSLARDTKCKLNRTTNNFGAVNERLGGLIMTPGKRKSLMPETLASPRTAQIAKRVTSPIHVQNRSPELNADLKTR